MRTLKCITYFKVLQHATRFYVVLPYTWSPNFKVRHDCTNRCFKVAFPKTPYYKQILRTTPYYKLQFSVLPHQITVLQSISPQYNVLPPTTRYYHVLQSSSVSCKLLLCTTSIPSYSTKQNSQPTSQPASQFGRPAGAHGTGPAGPYGSGRPETK